jgi:hypothetical protein
MALINSIAPAYKSAATANLAQPAASTAGLSGLIGSLFGSATPAYKTVDGKGAQAASSSGGLLGLFASAPSYKTAASVASAPDLASGVDECGCPAPDDPSDAPVCGPDEIVLL